MWGEQFPMTISQVREFLTQERRPAGSNPSYSQLFLTRTDPTINFAWEYSSPHPNVPADNFSVDWRTRLWVPADGYYTFYTLSDDGVQLKVCPSEFGFPCVGSPFDINSWAVHGQTENASQAIYLKRGSHHLDLFYFEAGGGATIKLMWAGPNIPKQVIPRNNLDPVQIGPPFGLGAAYVASEGASPAAEASEPLPALGSPSAPAGNGVGPTTTTRLPQSGFVSGTTALVTTTSTSPTTTTRFR